MKNFGAVEIAMGLSSRWDEITCGKLEHVLVSPRTSIMAEKYGHNFFERCQRTLRQQK